ncbi:MULTISPECIES: HNH endonuclease [Streptomyces]|uniref:HNH endonuclease n=2 Tax=Streptomyces TaxID=1883 RepID=A0ABV8NDW4_9ACTN|nr:HNH endonuclease [Streptomyces sp. MBT51]MBK3592441.1 HNH endonuclease [Streptomyces sp. MBT51]
METGDPLLTKKAPNGAFKALLKSAAVATGDACITVPDRTGRPVAQHNGRSMNASRVVWILANGDPGSLHVLHRCHNGQCLNIKHLYLGDHDRNMQDMAQAGRWDRGGRPVVRGEGHGCAVLTEDDVRSIRERADGGASMASLGREYGVHWRTVDKVVKRETWAHVS